MIILGIDPGVSGAYAFYATELNELAVDDIPVAGGQINIPEVCRLVRTHRPTFAVIEQAQSMPGNKPQSMFNYGAAFGDVRGAIGACEVPMHFVRPQVWKKRLGLSDDKDLSRLLALELFPSAADRFTRKKDHGRAEAALIAVYGLEAFGGFHAIPI